MSWFWRKKEEKPKIRTNCCSLTPMPGFEINIGDKFIDTDWGDKIVEVMKINKNRTEVRYRFINVGNKEISNGIHWEGSMILFNSYKPFYKKYTNE